MFMPTCIPCSYYWYGNKRKGPDRPPKWVDTIPLQKVISLTNLKAKIVPLRIQNPMSSPMNRKPNPHQTSPTRSKSKNGGHQIIKSQKGQTTTI